MPTRRPRRAGGPPAIDGPARLRRAQDLASLARSIHDLRRDDARFVRRLRAYERIDERLERIELGLEPASEAAIAALEREGTRLRHELYARVCAHARKLPAFD